jgi:tetratricopeptide (TPR) repeat protein
MNYFNNKKYKKSIPLFEKALKKAKGIEREDILYHLALAYENTGKYEKSMELYASLSNSQKYRAAVSRKLQEIKTKK